MMRNAICYKNLRLTLQEKNLSPLVLFQNCTNDRADPVKRFKIDIPLRIQHSLIDHYLKVWEAGKNAVFETISSISCLPVYISYSDRNRLTTNQTRGKHRKTPHVWPYETMILLDTKQVMRNMWPSFQCCVVMESACKRDGKANMGVQSLSPKGNYFFWICCERVRN